MRCEKIQERIVELLYRDGGEAVDPALEEHVGSCPTCRRSLEELRNVRHLLALWKDEPPVRPVQVGTAVTPLRRRNFVTARLLRTAAIAAAVLLVFLALANAELTWNTDGFSFKTRLVGWSAAGNEYYTKQEILSILKEVLDDSESRMMESNMLMMKRLMDTIEAERYLDLRRIAHQSVPNRNNND